MFDPGFWELSLIGILALLILGPERLPVVARKVGGWIGKGRRYINSVRADIERELRTEELEKMLNQQNDEIQELKSILSDSQQDLSESLKDTKNSLQKAIEMDEPDEPDYLVKAKPDPEESDSSNEESTDQDQVKSSKQV